MGPLFAIAALALGFDLGSSVRPAPAVWAEGRGALAQTASASEAFERGRTAFERGEHGRAIQLLRPLLYPEPRLRSERDLLQAHRMLGFAHLYERENDLAAREFRKLLQLRPDYRLDPLLDPPQVVEFFNGIVKQNQQELAELEAQRQAVEADERRRLEAARRGPIVIETTVVQRSFLVSFIPFGAGQFQNGQRRKAWAFLVGESVLGAVSVGAFVANFATYGVRPKIKCSASVEGSTSPGCPVGQVAGPEEARSRTLTRVQIASGALFFAAAAWGIADAVVNFVPMTRLDGPPPPAPRAGRAVLTPVMFETGALGGGLSFRF